VDHPRHRVDEHREEQLEGIAAGSAISGTGLTIGENVVGMDPDATFRNGRVSTPWI